ncbi:MAG: FliA/WhiG family RNA polymerase sigma factor [Pedosphaera sp.]|nr:FliA/WhiG family RNA polymerase sigma factor [Pedosphaera sp.]
MKANTQNTRSELQFMVSNPTADSVFMWKRYAKSGLGSTDENELVQQYLPLVKTVVGRLMMTMPAHVDFDDLNSAGLVGLLNAIRRFDPKCGASFETYARVRIRGEVLDEMRRMDWVPRSVHIKARKVQEAMCLLEQRDGEIPAPEEVAKEMGLSIEEYNELLEEIKPASFVCLDAARSADTDDGATQYESVADDRQHSPDDRAARSELVELITERLEELPDMQRKVLALYYFEDLRLREIAEAFGVTESRICQIHTQAILSIRNFLRRTEAQAA